MTIDVGVKCSDFDINLEITKRKKIKILKRRLVQGDYIFFYLHCGDGIFSFFFLFKFIRAFCTTCQCVCGFVELLVFLFEK